MNIRGYVGDKLTDEGEAWRTEALFDYLTGHLQEVSRTNQMSLSSNLSLDHIGAVVRQD